MILQRIEREILSLSTEDYQGLWEIRSQIEQRFGQDERDIRDALTNATVSLLERGWLQVFQGSLVENRATPLANEAAREILLDAGSWMPPESNQRQLLVGATEAGERR